MRGAETFYTEGKGSNILHLGGQIIYVGVGVYYEDVEVDEGKDVSKVGKLSTGDRFFRGP